MTDELLFTLYLEKFISVDQSWISFIYVCNQNFFSQIRRNHARCSNFCSLCLCQAVSALKMGWDVLIVLRWRGDSTYYDVVVKTPGTESHAPVAHPAIKAN